MEAASPADTFTTANKTLTDAEKLKLQQQDSRLVSDFKARQLEEQAQRNWDIFYKRNDTRFFKDRHWTTREFEDLLPTDKQHTADQPMQLLEVGCGVGNLIYPLITSQDAKTATCLFHACDFSPRAIEFVRAHPLYDEKRVHAFQCDITTDAVHQHIAPDSLDTVTLIFVLSAIHPDKFVDVIANVCKLLKPGGQVFFRDYGLYDMAQLRFKPGHKITDNFYVRQDGTRSYFFATTELQQLFESQHFKVVSNSYVHRRTVNVKEEVDVPRIFLQGIFQKPYNI